MFFRNVKLVFLFAGVLISPVVFSEDPQPALKFIQNKNQWPANINFTAKIPGGTMTIGHGKFHYYFLDNQKIRALHENSHRAEPDAAVDLNIRGHSLQANFIGANRSSEALPFGQSGEYYNYYLGNNHSHWASKAFAYTGILYPSFYSGIDLKIYSSGQNLKYDFIIAPYGDPSQIVVQYEGADFIGLDNGNLFLKTSLADLIEKRPFAYQYIDGKKTVVDCQYFLNGNLLSFCFPHGYDPCYELIIDPLLIFSTFSGSTADNWGSTATPGEGGTLYSAGVTNQQTFGGKYPVTPGVFQMNYGGDYDVGILKYDSTGSKLLYATFLGGTSAESPHSLVMNSSEELIVLGTSSSSNFPTTSGAFDRTYNGGTSVEHVINYPFGSDIFVARLNKDGTQLLASTYLGGSANDGLNPDNNGLVKNYGDQLRGDVIADAAGNIFISSVTASTNFPMINSIDPTYQGGFTDAILLKLNSDFSQILWSTYIGGSGSDASHTVKLDSEENIFVAGGTTSSNFPVTPGCYQSVRGGNTDGWIAKIAAEGSSILHATFTGETAFDQVYFLDLDQNDEPYVYGTTNNVNNNFPVTANVYSNPRGGQFIQKFDSTLSILRFSTVFGSGRGTPDLSPTAFLVNECNNIYLAGWGGGSLNSQISGGFETSTFGLRASEDAIQKSTSGHDFYFMVLTDNAQEFLYGTFLGGSQTLVHVDGGTSRFDKHGIVYHAVCAGCNTDGLGPKSDFPTTAKAWSRTNKSGNCNNAAFKFDLSSLKARIQTNSVALNMPGLAIVCIPDKIVFENFSIGGEIYKWDLGDGTQITEIDPIAITHEYKNEGQYLVKLKIIDQGTCREVDSTSTVVTVNKTSIEVQDDDALCSGNSYQLKASGGMFYEWKTKDGALVSNASNPTVSPLDTSQYFVSVYEANGCVRQDTVQLNVVPAIAPEFEFIREADCSDRPFIRVKNLTDNLNADDRLFFEFGDGKTSDLPEDHHYENDGVYNLKAVGIREFCVFEKIVTIPVFKIKLPNIITPGGSAGLNDNFTIQFGDTAGTTPTDYGYKVSLIIYNRWGSILYQTDDYDYSWSGEGLAAGIYYYEVTVEDHATCKSWLQIMK